MNKNAIFLSLDKLFVNNALLCLLSIQKNFKGHPDIIICHTNLGEDEKILLCSCCENITFIENDLTDEDVWPIMSHLKNTDPRVFYARFLLWKDERFNKYENILHLDCDTLVLQNLDELLSYDQFFMVQEWYDGDDQIFYDYKDPQLIWMLDEDGIHLCKHSGNAWVFLLPKVYRSTNFYEEILNIKQRYKKYIKRADQSIINLWCYKHWWNVSEDYSYNYQHRLINDKTDFSTIKIVHFNWISGKYRNECMNYFLENYKAWAENYYSFYTQIVSNDEK